MSASAVVKNVVIFTRRDFLAEEPFYVERWSKAEMPSLNVIVAHDVDEVIAKGMKPDDIDALILWMVFAEVLEPFLKACSEKKRLCWVHCAYAGIDKTLCPLLVDDPSITMTLTKDVYSSNLGEWVIASIMYWEKFIVKLQQQQKAHLWQRFYTQELRGKQMCVLGFGSIGQDAARKATAFGVHVTGVRRRSVPEAEERSTVSSSIAERVVGMEKLMDVLQTSDYVVLVLPLTPETKNSFTKVHFDAMKSSAIFVNIGRGETVDYDALYAALHDHKIAAASVDVADVEPLPPSSKLWDLENILISPHSAVLCHDAPMDSCALIKENLTRFVEGKPLLHHANKKLGY